MPGSTASGRAARRPRRAASACASAWRGHRPRVLVVDDEASIRDLLAKTLALAEYDVDVAPTAGPRSIACASIPTIC